MRRGSIGEDDYARFQWLRLGQLQRLEIVVVAEESLTATDHNGIDLESVLVNEIELHQRPHELTAAENQEVLAWLFLELPDLPIKAS